MGYRGCGIMDGRSGKLPGKGSPGAWFSKSDPPLRGVDDVPGTTLSDWWKFGSVNGLNT